MVKPMVRTGTPISRKRRKGGFRTYMTAKVRAATRTIQAPYFIGRAPSFIQGISPVIAR